MFFGIIFLIVVLADKLQSSDLRGGLLLAAALETAAELGILAVYVNG